MAEMLGEDRRMKTAKPVGGVEWLEGVRQFTDRWYSTSGGREPARVVKCCVFTLTAPSHDIDSHYI